MASSSQTRSDDDSQKILASLTTQLKTLTGRVDRGGVAAQYQFVDVVFPSTANQDLAVTHYLRPSNPEKVLAMAAMWEQIGTPTDAPFVYRDGSQSRRAWAPGQIYLRCNIASARCRLLLMVEGR